jgi:catechol 2,3-dioxygenase-like lactoylglutathione lyase family enzyme
MRIKGILEAAMYVDDLAAAEDFYTGVLNLAVHSRVPARHLFLRCGDGMFLLFNPDATSQPGQQVPSHGARGPGHVALAVDEADLAGWRQRLVQHGVEVEAEVTWPSGGRSIYFRDPAGNSIELATPQTWNLPA